MKKYWIAVFFSVSCHLPVTGFAETLTYNTGTGFFVNRDGYVLTNNHVIQDCQGQITVVGAVALAPAALVAADPEYDLALLKAEAMPTDQAVISTEKQPLQPGDPVVVIGYPGNAWQTGRTITREAKIIDGKGPHGDEKWLSFSDAVAKGNSGGPLLDASGNVVGVVAAKGKLYIYNASGAREEEVESFDLAVSLPVMRHFLDDNSVLYREADSGIYLSAAHITDDAQRYIVNVKCRVK